MRWLSKLRTYLGHDEENQVSKHQSDTRDAQTYYDSAKTALDEARQYRVEANKIKSSLVTLNSRNHYGESIMLSMMPREKKT